MHLLRRLEHNHLACSWKNGKIFLKQDLMVRRIDVSLCRDSQALLTNVVLDARSAKWLEFYYFQKSHIIVTLETARVMRTQGELLL